MNCFRRASVFLAPIGVLLSACGGEGAGADETIAVTQDPIINGTPISAATAGVVQLSNGCSATLITNSKVLTAAHCVDQYQTNPNGGTPTTPFSVFLTSTTWSAASKVWLHPNVSIDAAVVWLANPLPMNGSTTGYRRATPKVTADQLHNGALVIDGYGRFDAFGGQNVLRRGGCSAKKRAAGLLSCFPAGNPPTIQSFGDSGGPGSVFTTGLPVVYIQSGCFFGSNGIPTECYGNTSDVWRDWAIWLLQ